MDPHITQSPGCGLKTMEEKEQSRGIHFLRSPPDSWGHFLETVITTLIKTKQVGDWIGCLTAASLSIVCGAGRFTLTQTFWLLITPPLRGRWASLRSPARKCNHYDNMNLCYANVHIVKCSMFTILCAEAGKQHSMQQLRRTQLSTARYTVINLKWLPHRSQRCIHVLLLRSVCFLPVVLFLIEWTEKAGVLSLIVPPTPTSPYHISETSTSLLQASHRQLKVQFLPTQRVFVRLLLQQKTGSQTWAWHSLCEDDFNYLFDSGATLDLSFEEQAGLD